jgi:hypothetical protein
MEKEEEYMNPMEVLQKYATDKEMSDQDYAIWINSLEEQRKVPSLRNLSGRTLALFERHISKEIRKFVNETRLELKERKCFDEYTEAICSQCKHNSGNWMPLNYCNVYGEELAHPNTEEWYYSISHCPHFEQAEYDEKGRIINVIDPPLHPVKQATSNNYLAPAGEVNCPACFNELYYISVETDNPFDTIKAECKHCGEKWAIRVYSTEKRMEIWSLSEATKK